MAVHSLWAFHTFLDCIDGCLLSVYGIPDPQLFQCFVIIMISTECDGGTPAGSNFSFGSATYTFTHPHNSSPNAIVGNMTLFIRLNYIMELLGSVGSSGFALQFDFFSLLGFLMIEGVLNPFRLDDDAVLEVGTGRRQWRHNTSNLNNYVIINSTDYSECSSENMTYLSIPVAFLLSKGPRTVGKRQWDINLRSIALANFSNEVFLSSFTRTIVNVITHPIESE